MERGHCDNVNIAARPRRCPRPLLMRLLLPVEELFRPVNFVRATKEDKAQPPAGLVLIPLNEPQQLQQQHRRQVCRQLENAVGNCQAMEALHPRAHKSLSTISIAPCFLLLLHVQNYRRRRPGCPVCCRARPSQQARGGSSSGRTVSACTGADLAVRCVLLSCFSNALREASLGPKPRAPEWTCL